MNLKLGDEEFSTELVLESDVSRMGGDLSQVKTLQGAQTYSRLRHIGDMMKILNSQNPNGDLEEFIDNANGHFEMDDVPVFYELLRDSTYLIPHHDNEPVLISDQNDIAAIAAFTSDERYNLDDDFKIKRMKFLKMALLFKDDDIDGIVLNPGSQTLFLSKDMIGDVIFGR